MLSKPATLLMGIINEKPLNAYEITKLLAYMNIKWWFNVADSTVYATLKNLEKRGLIEGTIERAGNMPDRTIYSLTEKGEEELKETIKKSILQFSYDTNIFTIAAFFMDILETEEKKELLEERLHSLQSYLTGISKQDNEAWKQEAPGIHVANLERMIDIVQAEISGTKRLLSVIREGKNIEK
ncbi:MAG: PadR family transcriptional regulator [Lachnospiraceae bacterium]|nr:PadR family transcriptional regulator [Lachnospiraceae bacterium]